ncbi:hypothetical protein Fcan01_13712 [Folsomia candida]|uniref:Uncharacterized protein n=1 Tax=Folsomia candida TaxID=158441 RepID=A0A226E4X1_FOLCA|nr:hypothetical protein Fcan01_13712 [Folsomia candida]
MACCAPPRCPGVTCPPIMIQASMCPSPCGQTSPSCCPSPPSCCSPCLGNGQKALEGCPGGRNRREKRWKQCNFLKPCIDTRVYRNGEAMCISYAGHIPGEQYIHGRNLPTTTTFAKRRLCQYTPYEFVDPDGKEDFTVAAHSALILEEEEDSSPRTMLDPTSRRNRSMTESISFQDRLVGRQAC